LVYYKRKSSLFYDNSSELPYFNLRKIRETSNLNYLFKSSTHKEPGKVSPFLSDFLKKKWHKIINDDIKKHGVDKDFQKIIEAEISFCENTLKAIIDEDRSAEMLADMAEIDLQSFKGLNQYSKSMSEIFAYISKYMGFHINEKSITLDEFRGISKMIEAQNRVNG